jgi:hypothetical protein
VRTAVRVAAVACSLLQLLHRHLAAQIVLFELGAVHVPLIRQLRLRVPKLRLQLVVVAQQRLALQRVVVDERHLRVLHALLERVAQREHARGRTLLLVLVLLPRLLHLVLLALLEHARERAERLAHHALALAPKGAVLDSDIVASGGPLVSGFAQRRRAERVVGDAEHRVHHRR